MEEGQQQRHFPVDIGVLEAGSSSIGPLLCRRHFSLKSKVNKLQLETALTQHTRYVVPIWIEPVNIRPKHKVIFTGEVGSEIMPGRLSRRL
jgi:hypothetical protein